VHVAAPIINGWQIISTGVSSLTLHRSARSTETLVNTRFAIGGLLHARYSQHHEELEEHAIHILWTVVIDSFGNCSASFIVACIMGVSLPPLNHTVMMYS
jgi:hypothetical protein